MIHKQERYNAMTKTFNETASKEISNIASKIVPESFKNDNGELTLKDAIPSKSTV